MKYELIKNSNAGVIIDPTPILIDIKDTFKVSFVLPEESAYIALFRGEDNVEYKVVINDNVALVPKQLFKKEQRVGLTVCQLDGGKIIHAWECHSLRIGAFLYLRQTQWQITAAVDDKELYHRLAELERVYAQVNELLENVTELKQEYEAKYNKAIEQQEAMLAELKKIAKSYNLGISLFNINTEVNNNENKG